MASPIGMTRTTAILHMALKQAYEAFQAQCVFSYEGGIFVANPELLLWLAHHYVTTEESVLILDRSSRPLSVNRDDLYQKARLQYDTALEVYHKTYTGIIAELQESQSE